MNLLIIWAWEGLWDSLLSYTETFFDTIYTVSRNKRDQDIGITHIVWDVTKDIDFNSIDINSLDVVVYIPSLWGTHSEMTSDEFEDYMNVWPKWLLKCFHSLKDGNYCNTDCLFVSIGSTASETALSLSSNPSSHIYSLAKLSQKSTLISLSHLYKDYRYLNITLGSIGTEEDWGVGYENICNTITHIASLNTWVRYSDVALVSSLDITQ